jgi:hypothetical protein
MGQPPFRQGDGIIIEKVQRVGKQAEKQAAQGSTSFVLLPV